MSAGAAEGLADREEAADEDEDIPEAETDEEVEV